MCRGDRALGVWHASLCGSQPGPTILLEDLQMAVSMDLACELISHLLTRRTLPFSAKGCKSGCSCYGT